MRSAALAPTIQHDYTNEIVFAMADVAEQKINFLDDAFTIIDLKDFKHRSAFTFPTPQAAEAFWYNLFGMVDANDPMTGHYPCYLTQESCDQILKTYPQFLSGIDYKHLPKGFFIAKNPQQGGVRNI